MTEGEAKQQHEGLDDAAAVPTSTTSGEAHTTLYPSSETIAELSRAASVGSWEWAVEADEVMWSDGLYTLFGLTPDVAPQTAAAYLALVHPDDRDTAESSIRQALLERRGFSFDYRAVGADGQLRWFHCIGHPVSDDNGSVVRLRGTAQDITERKRAELALTHQVRSFRHFVDTLDEGIVACDGEGRITFWNAALERILAQPREGLTARAFAALHAVHDVAGSSLPEDRFPLVAAADGGTVDALPITVSCADGVRRHLVATARPTTGPDGDHDGAVMVVHDVTRVRDAEVRLATIAHHDPLTGLPMRSLLLEAVGAALARAGPGAGLVAVAFVDIDGFSAVNEDCGHAEGDLILVAVGERLGALAPNAMVARMGDDEFAVVCEGMAGKADATAVGERVASALRAPITGGRRSLAISASVGVALGAPDETDVETLVRQAEEAAGLARSRGRGMYEVFDAETWAASAARAALERDLATAVERDELRLVFQPRVGLESDEVVGVEALLRWEHPERGEIMPADFIPVAEESGLVVPIGSWVIQEACRQAARWRAQLGPDRVVRVSVNVSARQFGVELLDVITHALEEAAVPPGALGIEVTESVVMDDVETAVGVLSALRELGIEIAIDDFGTGYSSLASLKRLPLDILKIDRSFVRGLGEQAEDTAITAAIVGMAHALDVAVVAEGVETAEQHERLRVLGCEEAQGFYLSRPQPPDVLLPALSGDLPLRPAPGAAAPTLAVANAVVADDAPDVVHLATMSLTTTGCAVRTAGDGDSALALAREVRPDCVVLDIEMPGMDGLEVCRELRADASFRSCTIVMLTSNDDAEGKVAAFGAGADDYIVKPFAPRDLVSRVRAAVRRRRETLQLEAEFADGRRRGQPGRA